MNFKGIVYANGVYVVDTHYVSLYKGLLKELKVKDSDNLRKALFMMYSEESPYYDVSIDERFNLIKNYEFKEDVSDLEKIINSIGERILELFEGQEERVYRKLRERIDRLIKEYSDSQIDLESLSEEPKKVKAISELLSIKEKLMVNIKNKGKNRGDKEESILEQL